MAGAKPGPNLIHGEIARAAIHAPLNSRRRASCSSGGSEPQRPCSVGLMTALGWMSSIVFVAIGPAYTVDAYSGGLRGHCTFIYSEKNKTKKQKLAARQKKSLIQPPGNPTNGGRLSILGRNTLVQ